MRGQAARKLSPWRLRFDIVVVAGFARMVCLGREGRLSPELHMFLYDRYWRLGKWHEARGRARRAQALKSRALHHWEETGYDGPPFAAALAMPVPLPPSGEGGRAPKRGPMDSVCALRARA
jgi:hypothetical protein